MSNVNPPNDIKLKDFKAKPHHSSIYGGYDERPKAKHQGL